MAQLSDDCFAFGGPAMTIEEATRLMAERVEPVATVEMLDLPAALGRVLAEDVVAGIDLPPFANSAVDGYAVRHADLAAGGDTLLPLEGRIAAGASGEGIAAAGRAVRVFTGAALPEGADTVFMQEDVVLEAGGVRLPAGLKRGANARPAGEDIARGALALAAGTRLGPAELALAAALGRTALPVRRRLRVGVFSTGDELAAPGAALGPAQIHDSNRIALMALAARSGAEPVDLGILRDSRAALAEGLAAAAARCDVILTSGGVSAGEEDHVRDAVQAVGSLVFWRVAIKPGRPVALGVVRGVPLVGLPGNPVAVYVTYAFIVRPLLARLSGEAWREPRRIAVTMQFPYRKKPGRREYVRVRLTPRPDGGYDAHKHPRDGAGVLTSLTATDGLLELPDAALCFAAGDVAAFIPYEALG